MSASDAASRRGDSSRTSVASISARERRKLTPRGLAGRRKSREVETVGGQAGEHQAGERRRGARQHGHRNPARVRFADEAESRVRDQRRARVADQRNDLPRLDAPDQGGTRRGRVVVVIGGQAARYAVRGQQLPGDARILAGDRVGGAKRVQRPQRDVAQVADRRCHQIEPGRHRPLRHRFPLSLNSARGHGEGAYRALSAWGKDRAEGEGKEGRASRAPSTASSR